MNRACVTFGMGQKQQQKSFHFEKKKGKYRTLSSEMNLPLIHVPFMWSRKWSLGLLSLQRVRGLGVEGENERVIQQNFPAKDKNCKINGGPFGIHVRQCSTGEVYRGFHFLLFYKLCFLGAKSRSAYWRGETARTHLTRMGVRDVEWMRAEAGFPQVLQRGRWIPKLREEAQKCSHGN